MQILRTSLLWASQNSRMERLVRGSSAMRPLVRRFMPGEDMPAVLDAVRRLRAEGTPAVLTYLGENVTDDAAADASAAEYSRLLAELAREASETHVSVKLTQLGWDLDHGRATDRVRRLADVAEAMGSMVVVDMESSAYVESTMDMYASVAQERRNVGLCLQAYLHRTPGDLARLLPLHPYIRLVKGAYREPGSLALQQKRDIDDRYLALARDLLVATRDGTRVAFGTHDLALVQRIREAAAASGVDERSFEVHMLYGIQDEARRRLAAEGVRTRVLVSYGRSWYPWFMRRLAEKPANLMYVVRNVI